MARGSTPKRLVVFSVVLVPLLLIAGLVIDFLRSDARLPRFLGLVPSGIHSFVGTDRLSDFAEYARPHWQVVRQLVGMSEDNSKTVLTALGSLCLESYTPSGMALAGLDGKRPAALLHFSDESIGLLLPVLDQRTFQRNLKARLAERPRIEIVRADADAGLDVQIAGRAPPGTVFCGGDKPYTVPASGEVDLVLEGKSAFPKDVVLPDLPAELNLSCQVQKTDASGAQSAASDCSCWIGDQSCGAPIRFEDRSVETPDHAPEGWLAEKDGAVFCYGEPVSDYALVSIWQDTETDCVTRPAIPALTDERKAQQLRHFAEDDTFRAAMRMLTGRWHEAGGSFAGILPLGYPNPATSTAIFEADLDTSSARIGALAGLSPWAGALFEHLTRPVNAEAMSLVDPDASFSVRLERPAVVFDALNAMQPGPYALDDAEFTALFNSFVDLARRDRGTTALSFDIRPDDQGLLGHVLSLQFAGGSEAAMRFRAELAQRAADSHRTRQISAIEQDFEHLTSDLSCDTDPTQVMARADSFRAEIGLIGQLDGVVCPPDSLRSELPASADHTDDIETLQEALDAATTALVADSPSTACAANADDIWAIATATAAEDDVSLPEEIPPMRVACHWRLQVSQDPLPAGSAFVPEPASGPAGAAYISPALTAYDVDRIVASTRKQLQAQAEAAEAQGKPVATTRPIDADGLQRGDYRWVGWVDGDMLYLAARPSLVSALAALKQQPMPDKMAITLDSAELNAQLSLYPAGLRESLAKVTGGALNDYAAATMRLEDVPDFSAVHLEADLMGLHHD